MNAERILAINLLPSLLGRAEAANPPTRGSLVIEVVLLLSAKRYRWMAFSIMLLGCLKDRDYLGTKHEPAGRHPINAS